MKCKTCGQEIQKIAFQIIPTKTLEWGATCEKELNWEDAKKWCAEQGKGWRLPNIEELFSAWYNKVEGFQSGYYWSETEYSDTYARFVNFTDGYQYNNNKTATYYVRCVRG